jgi:hypothetical protein
MNTDNNLPINMIENFISHHRQYNAQPILDKCKVFAGYPEKVDNNLPRLNILIDDHVRTSVDIKNDLNTTMHLIVVSRSIRIIGNTVKAEYLALGHIQCDDSANFDGILFVE